MSPPEVPGPDALEHQPEAAPPDSLPLEADPADALEQAAEVPDPDDDRR